jgi:TonB family protein
MPNLGQAHRWLRQNLEFTLPAVLLLLSIFLGGMFSTPHCAAQESKRKVIARVEPDYPDALKKLYIGGVVRVELDVTPNGTVKDVKLLGGNPILGQSTIKAVKMWRYAPATAEEKLTVKLEFDPHK